MQGLCRLVSRALSQYSDSEEIVEWSLKTLINLGSSRFDGSVALKEFGTNDLAKVRIYFHRITSNYIDSIRNHIVTLHQVILHQSHIELLCIIYSRMTLHCIASHCIVSLLFILY